MKAGARAAGWSRPELMPFAGRFKDYEASLSPDGQWMLFNSWRPLPDGREITNRKNNLWLTRRTPQGWSAPEYLAGINRFETEESYAAIAPDGLIVFLGEGAADANGPDWNLYQTRLTGNHGCGANTVCTRGDQRPGRATRGLRGTAAT